MIKEENYTLEDYIKIYGENGYCSLEELERLKLYSTPEEYKKIENHWYEAHLKEMEELTKL